MGMNYSVARAQEWESRIRELEPGLSGRHAKAISIELARVEQARAKLYGVIIDAGLDHEAFEERVRTRNAAQRSRVPRARVFLSKQQ